VAELYQVIQTKDGSSTIYTSQWDAHYHSTHGAIQESLHVFIQAGLDHWLKQNKKPDVRILEYGMGTGLNCLLSLDYATTTDVKLNYTTLEAYPLSSEILETFENDLPYFKALHDLSWEEQHQLTEHFSILKHKILFEDYRSSEQYDIIFYDAFGPGAQPSLWERPLLEQVVDMMAPGGAFVTYCAQGAFKRVLKGLGLAIERLPGPPGKREMTRASKV